MIISVAAIILLVSIVAVLHRFSPFVAGLVMTFPIITILSIIIADPAETKKFIMGAFSGVIPLCVMLFVYLMIYHKFLKFPAICISFFAWVITAGLQFFIFGRHMR